MVEVRQKTSCLARYITDNALFNSARDQTRCHETRRGRGFLSLVSLAERVLGSGSKRCVRKIGVSNEGQEYSAIRRLKVSIEPRYATDNHL